MTTLALPSEPMDKRKNMPVRISEEALRWARIAASYKEMNLAEYVSKALIEVAKRDAEQGHAELTKEAEDQPKPKKGAK